MTGLGDLATVLHPVIQSLRRVMRNAPDDPPEALRRVAASSARRLPAPLAAAAIASLDADADLRSRVLEDLESRAEPPSEVAEAFLRRDPGWWQIVVSALGAEAERRFEANTAAASREIEKLASSRDAAQRKAKARINVLQADVKDLKQRLASQRRQFAEARKSMPGPGEATPEAQRDLEDRVRALESELVDARTEVERLNDAVRRLARERAEAERRALRGGSEWTRDSIALARRLDELATLALANGDESPSSHPAEADLPDVTLPAGVAPDTAAAVDYLASVAAPLVVVVDGYNLAGAIVGANFSTPEARARVNNGLARFRRQALGATQVIVVYDAVTGRDEATFRRVDGIDVVFTDPGQTADEHIHELLGVANVVVSSDRAVRELADGSRALGLWSEAFAAWI